MGQQNSDDNTGTLAEQSAGSAADPLIGGLFDEKFTILSQLGEGASGRVYQAQHKMLDRIVALKIIHHHVLESDTALQRLQKEASVLSDLDHPNLVKFYSFGTTRDGTFYIVTECLGGKTLAQLLKENTALNAARAVPIFLDICRGLDYAHKLGVIHRDIKPGNIMVQEADGIETAKILDFGVFKRLDGSDQKLTETGILIGSANYMSPEQCTGSKLDVRSDIYSLACLMYECLVGLPPMLGTNDLDTMQNQLNKVLKSVPAKQGISESLEQIILKCLNKVPRQRIQSVEDLAAALSSVSLRVERRFAPAKQAKIAIAFIITAGIIVVAISYRALQEHRNRTSYDSIALNKHFTKSKAPSERITTIKQLEACDNWLTANVNAKQYAAPELADIYCNAQEAHRCYSVLGAPPEGTRIVKRLKTYIKNAQERTLDETPLPDFEKRLHARFLLARLLIDESKFPQFWSVIHELENDKEDITIRNSKLNVYLSSFSDFSAQVGDRDTALALLKKASSISESRQDFPQLLVQYIKEAQYYKESAKPEEQREITNKACEALEICLDQSLFTVPFIALYCCEQLNSLGEHKQIAKLLIYYFVDKTNVETKPKHARSKSDFLLSERSFIESRIELARAYSLSKEHSKAIKTVNAELDERLLQLNKLQFDHVLTGLFISELILANPPGLEKRLRSFLDKSKDEGPEQYLRSMEPIINSLGVSPLRNELLKEADTEISAYENSVPLLCGEIRIAFGEILSNEGHDTEALIQYMQAIKELNMNALHSVRSAKDQQIKAYYGAVLSLVNLHNYKSASDTLREVNARKLFDSADLEQAPFVFGFKYLHGCILFNSGQQQEALKLHEDLLRQYPGYPVAGLKMFNRFCNTLADEYERLNQREHALATLQTGLDLLHKYKPIDLDWQRSRLVKHLKSLQQQ